MKYQAKPITVVAHKIVSVGPPVGEPCVNFIGRRQLTLSNGERVIATEVMLARMTPVPGDFWVIQSDGYVYLNPRDVFLRKYEPAEEPCNTTA